MQPRRTKGSLALATATFIAGALTACGPRTPDSASFISADVSMTTTHRPLVIVVGGFNSCLDDETYIDNQGMFINSAKYREDLATRWGQPVSVITTCFHKHMSELNYYEMISGEEHVTVKKVSWKQFMYEVARVFGSDPTYVGFIYGHSWGGKLAIDTAMAMPKTFDIRQLTTLDPIDPNECTPTDALMGMMTIDPEPGCLRAPRDRYNLFKKLTTKVKRWSNYYQEDAWGIHSGEIAGASENERRFYPDVKGDAWTAHTKVDDDQAVWGKQYGRVLSDVLNDPTLEEKPKSPIDPKITTVAKND